MEANTLQAELHNMNRIPKPCVAALKGETTALLCLEQAMIKAKSANSSGK